MFYIIECGSYSVISNRLFLTVAFLSLSLSLSLSLCLCFVLFCFVKFVSVFFFKHFFKNLIQTYLHSNVLSVRSFFHALPTLVEGCLQSRSIRYNVLCTCGNSTILYRSIVLCILQF